MDLESAASRRELKRAMLVCAVAVLGYFVEDWVIVGHFAAWASGLRLLWAAGLAGVALRIPSASEREKDVLLCVASALSVLSFAAVVWLTGVGPGGNLIWMACLPLGVALVTQANVPSTLLCCALTLIAIPGVLRLDGASWRTVLAASGEALAACGLAVYGLIFLSRLRKAEREEHLERMKTLDRLSESETQRARAERLALIGRLVSGVAHEINNPLAFVGWNLEFLKLAHERGEQLSPEEFNRVITESLDGLLRIREIVSDLSGFAREAKNEAEECRVGEVLEEALRLASVRVNRVCRVERKIDAGIPRVRVNRRRLCQVLVNLLVNAADALEESDRTPKLITVGAAVREGQISLWVEDSGPGIPEGMLSSIFEPFVTTKAQGKGTGLGLALSREYVERFGGQLLAENRAEGGARFVLILPLAPGDAARAA